MYIRELSIFWLTALAFIQIYTTKIAIFFAIMTCFSPQTEENTATNERVFQDRQYQVVNTYIPTQLTTVLGNDLLRRNQYLLWSIARFPHPAASW